METRIIDGKQVARQIDVETAEEVCALARQGVVPGLAVVLVGEDPASATYVRMKEQACARLGIRSVDHRVPTDVTQDELNRLVDELNADPQVHGILVQLPLPDHLDEEQVIARMNPSKDVDGFSPVNLGRLVRGLPSPRACTPLGVMRLLDAAGVDCVGKRAVVVGRSTIVGKPMALLLLEAHATVTVCHSRTIDLAGVCREADILIAAIGRAKMIDREYVKPGAVVVDVGINRTDEGLVGDVDAESVMSVASAITPVPGGVGPMTIAMLMSNTVQAARQAAGLQEVGA